MIEVYGPESGGKTTLTLHVIAEAQKLGGQAAFIDAEHALDPAYARKLGVDVDNLLVSQPDNGEQALEIAEALIRSNAVDVMVVDSVAALVPKAELEGEMGDPQMGLQARLMSQALRKLTAIVSKSKTCLIFINQIREKIGVMFGNPETTTGGRALKFYASIRVDIRRIQSIKEGDRVIGSRTRAKVVKNKVAAPFREAEFDIIYGEGVSREGDLLDLGVMKGMLEKSGTWISYKGERLGPGTRKCARVPAREYRHSREDRARSAQGARTDSEFARRTEEAGAESLKSRPPWRRRSLQRPRHQVTSIGAEVVRLRTRRLIFATGSEFCVIVLSGCVLRTRTAAPAATPSKRGRPERGSGTSRCPIRHSPFGKVTSRFSPWVHYARTQCVALRRTLMKRFVYGAAAFVALAMTPVVHAQSQQLVPGTQVRLRLMEGLTTRVAHNGDPFTAIVTEPAFIGNQIVLPAGAKVHGTITSVERPRLFSMFRGGASMNLVFNSIEVESRIFPARMSILTIYNNDADTGKERKDLSTVEGVVVEERHDLKTNVEDVSNALPPLRQHVLLGAQHLDQHIRTSRRIDLEQRVQVGAKAPGPHAEAVLLVASLVDVEPIFVRQAIQKFLIGLLQRTSHLTDDRRQLPARDRHVDDIADELPDGRERSMADPLEVGDQGGQSGPDQSPACDLELEAGPRRAFRQHGHQPG